LPLFSAKRSSFFYRSFLNDQNDLNEPNEPNDPNQRNTER
jgi:hypothetical protein